MDDTGEPLRPVIERDRHCEEKVPVGEVGRPVDRVDVPDQLAFSALGVLFSDDPVRGELSRKMLADQLLAREVVLGQQVEAPLARDLPDRAPAFHHEFTGLQRHALGDLESTPTFLCGGHEVVHFRGFLALRHRHLGCCRVFAGILASKPVKGRALRSRWFERRRCRQM